MITYINSNVEFLYRCPCGTRQSAWITAPEPGVYSIVEHNCAVCAETFFMSFSFDGNHATLESVFKNLTTFTRSAVPQQTTPEVAPAVWAATYAQAFAYLKLKDGNGAKSNDSHATIAAHTADEAVAALGSHGVKR